LSAALGGLGLMLAAIGIYGTVAYSVARRTREIGIRMTLGARSIDVLRLILRGAMRPIVLGAGVGMVICAAVSRILASLLFGVSPLDAIAYVSVAMFLLGVALLASYLPARRALRVDPMVALRHE
jgi:putative ABC transport system permease protein